MQEQFALPEIPDVSPDALTPRELEIVTRIARGDSNQEIADALFLSINSVKTYIRGAYRTLGITRRTQVIRWAAEQGVTQLPRDEA